VLEVERKTGGQVWPSCEVAGNGQVLIWAARRMIGIPKDSNQRFELMSITILKRVRVHDGFTDPEGNSRGKLFSPCNGMSQIAEI
jgi:hypothetical protein